MAGGISGGQGIVVSYAPDKGDVVWLNFDPSGGREIVKRRPAFVISRKAFSEHTGLAIVAPITSSVRNIRLEVVLPEAMLTQGAVLVHQLKSLDFEHREMEFIETAPRSIADQVTTLVRVITQ